MLGHDPKEGPHQRHRRRITRGKCRIPAHSDRDPTPPAIGRAALHDYIVNRADVTCLQPHEAGNDVITELTNRILGQDGSKQHRRVAVLQPDTATTG
ncbi:hypothetical protein JCM4914_75880 [Streptomyces platensis subsp. malvinus]